MTVCDRCGKKCQHDRTFNMGDTKENSANVCPNCHHYWHSHYISLLNKMHLSPDKWGEEWEKAYAKFMSFGKTVKEKVIFT